MKKIYRSVLSLLLAAALLCGCATSGGSMREHLAAHEKAVLPQQEELLTFDQMVYERPDMDVLAQTLEEACTLAGGEDVEAIMDAVFAYYDAYDWFYTCYSLADIHYSMDLTDSYWEAEYYYCVEQSAEVDAGLEELYYTLAASPCRQTLEGEDYFGSGFFDSYDGENGWDDHFTELLEREAELENRYYDLSGEAGSLTPGAKGYYTTYGEPMAQVLVDLILVRQEIAAYWGYDNYVDFAWDFYYYRDYTPAQMENYMASISRELVPIYRQMARTDVWDQAYRYASQEDTFAFVKEAVMAMGGTVAEAFGDMESRGLFDLSYSPNKYSTSFEVYLTSYQSPFVFVCPGLEVYDRLTFAHEFGHFCNDFASGGSYAGIDVLEIFSQGMEYLSLCYGADTGPLTRVKLADSLCTYVEQAAFATFEHRAYSLSGEDLTVEGLCALYDEVAQAYGFDAVGYDPMEFVTITHFYTNPLYIDSYVVSNDAALQLYLMELEAPGTGLALFEENLDTTEAYFLAFLEIAGLESPFAPGQLESVRDLLERQLLG